MPKYRNRIKAFRTVNARDIRENEQNFRQHGQAQADELKALLEDVGMVDVLKCVETDDGDLLLVDGHLRRDLIGNGTVQVAILDLDERETKRVLAHFDAIGHKADVDEDALNRLLQEIAASEAPPPDEAAIGAVLDAVAETPVPIERDTQEAQAVAASATRAIQRLAHEAPGTLAKARAVIAPTEGFALLVLVDPDLDDIIAELRQRAEAGETHPLDRLFACIWEPGQ